MFIHQAVVAAVVELGYSTMVARTIHQTHNVAVMVVLVVLVLVRVLQLIRVLQEIHLLQLIMVVVAAVVLLLGRDHLLEAQDLDQLDIKEWLL
jgi:hypothetical protein